MNVVGYVRLSRDEDRENYSSVESQMNIISNYAADKNWTISRMYVDDNYSGYSFNRPAFNEMCRELKAGRIDIILAKDLSRIGRHNARTQLFLEEVQELGKRILLPEEGRGYDSKADDDDIIGIKTWYNERYVKDISRKIKSSMYMRQKNGSLIMGNLYGYIKDPADRSKLYVDESVRPIIEMIFKLYINGMGYKKICDILDKKGCPTPSMNLKKKSFENGKVFKNAVSKKWQTHNIQRIIQNDLYIGTLRTHKKQNTRIKGKQEKVSRGEQFVFESHHEPIISKEDFELVQRINFKRKEAGYKGKAKYGYLFSSFVFCGDCGFAATGRNIARSPKIVRGYECTQYTKHGLNRCVSHSVPEDKLLFFFKEFLRDVKAQYGEYLSSMSFEKKKKDFGKEYTRLRKELDASNERFRQLISQKVMDVMKEKDTGYRKIIESNYLELENEEKRRIRELSARLEAIQEFKSGDIGKNIKSAIELYDMAIERERPERKLLEIILDKIYIYHDKSIEFRLLADIEKMTFLA